jgi:hypothetical protein
MRDTHDSFLTELADLPPAEQTLQLARTIGEIVRATAADPGDRREAVDNLLLIIERAAGLRL